LPSRSPPRVAGADLGRVSGSRAQAFILTRIRAIGGNTRNQLLMRIKASVYGRPIALALMP
jgi:ribulose kinase